MTDQNGGNGSVKDGGLGMLRQDSGGISACFGFADPAVSREQYLIAPSAVLKSVKPMATDDIEFDSSFLGGIPNVVVRGAI